MHTPRARRSFFSTIALSACTLFATAGLAHADDADDWSLGWGGGWDGMAVYQGPTLSLATTQLERIADVLGLDETQRDEMMSLFGALEDEHLAAWVRFAEANTDVQSKGMSGKNDWAEIQREQGEILDAYEEEQDRLVDLMLSDLELIVSPEQAERWETLERERRRMDTLTRYGCYPAERYDLVEVVKTLDLEDTSAIDPVLERYASELDPILTARNRALERAATVFESYTEAQQQLWAGFDWEDPEATQRYQQLEEEMNAKMREAVGAALEAKPACARVAEHNERYADEVRGLLDGRAQREFDELVKTAGNTGAQGGFDMTSYSRARQKFSAILNLEDMIGAYRTWSESMGGEEWGIMRIAREMEPLTPKQVSDIEELEERFEAEMELIDARRPGAREEDIDMMKWSFALRTEGGTMQLNHNDPPEDVMAGMAKGQMGGAFINGQQGGEEMMEWMADRTEVEQRYIELLRQELTLRQRALIALN